MNARLKRFLVRNAWPLMPGWPDEGRRIVQDPHLRDLLGRAATSSHRFPRVFNAGSGEGGYSGLLLGLPGVESLVESDFGWRSQHAPRIDARQVFFCSSLTSIPTPERSFDLVLCTEVLEHIADDQKALDEIERVLNPGGWLVITVPTPPAEPDSAHVREGYAPDQLAGMLTERGFNVIETRFCMHVFFRFVLRKWSRFRPWCPRLVIRSLAYLDRLFSIGPPMDVMILARKPAEAAPRKSRSKSLVEMEAAG